MIKLKLGNAPLLEPSLANSLIKECETTMSLDPPQWSSRHDIPSRS